MTSTLTPSALDDLAQGGPVEGLTASDRAALTRALAVLRAARQAAAGADPAVAAKGRQQLSMIIGYVTGYIDARTGGAGAAPGLGGLFPPDTTPDLDTALDRLESLLESAARPDALQRISIGDAVVAVGEFLTAAGQAVVDAGHALQAAGI